MLPGWAKEYKVVPDGDTHALAGRWSREGAREACLFGPTHPVAHLDGVEIDFGEPSKIDELVEVQRDFLRDGICEQWRMLSAVDHVAVEGALEFDGEDPAVPEMRQVLDRCETKLKSLHEDAQRYTGSFELPPPTEDELAFVREIAERGEYSMNLGRRLAQLEDETAPSAEIGSWRTRAGEPFSPAPELRAHVEQQAERRARVAVWVPDAEPGQMVLLLPEVGARTPPQAIEVPPELAEP